MSALQIKYTHKVRNIMSAKNSKNKPSATPSQRNAQILFSIVALIVILSMVFSAISKF
ncbi:MAG: hypothetical protein Fur002_06020 [Anaerolineales bacterium]